jgi:hypothetical protein
MAKLLVKVYCFFSFFTGFTRLSFIFLACGLDAAKCAGMPQRETWEKNRGSKEGWLYSSNAEVGQLCRAQKIERAVLTATFTHVRNGNVPSCENRDVRPLGRTCAVILLCQLPQYSDCGCFTLCMKVKFKTARMPF